ncbi:MAG: hypothetical protein ABMB14_15290 [Myxococcota bacterium]
MAILTRIEEIRAVEHLKLRTALARVDTALREIAERAAEPVAVARRVDLFGDPIYGDVPVAVVKRVDPAPLIKAWQPFEAAVLDRLDLWEMTLWPLVRRWSDGEGLEPEVQQLAADLLTSRDTVDKHLREVRKQSWFVEEIAPAMLVVYGSLELCDRAEQDEVIPALLSGCRETADRAERTSTSDDVTRNLRARIRESEEDEPQRTSNSPLGRFLSWIAGPGGRT